EDLSAKYPRAWPTRLVLTLSDGTVLRGASDYPVGNPENPVTTEQLEQKFASLVVPRWGEAPAARARHAIHLLESWTDMADAVRRTACRRTSPGASGESGAWCST